MEAIAHFPENIDFHGLGRGFTWNSDDLDKDREEAMRVLSNNPKDLHIVITGRAADPKLLEFADLVTEMKAVKHPYKQGVKAQKGIEF